MNYTQFAECLIVIDEKDFNDLLDEFRNPDVVNYDSISGVFPESSIEDLFEAIVYNNCDPEGDYIDDMDISYAYRTITIWERLDVENKESYRKSVRELLNDDWEIIFQ